MKQIALIWAALLLCLPIFVFLPRPLLGAEPVAVLAEFETDLSRNPDDMRLASEYRQMIIQTGDYDRGIAFFEKLVQDHPDSASAHLNYGFAYVDKIPVAGSITQVILANNALTEFTRSIELQPSWIAYYTRGNSYLYWPKIFGRTPLGIADLEAAMKLQKADRKRSYHVRSFIALGDGHWKMDELDKAAAVWKEGWALFPENAALKARLSKNGEELKAFIDSSYDVTQRVDTSLKELWAEQGSESK